MTQPKSPTISLDALLCVLGELAEQHGVRGTARKLGFSGGYIGNVLKRREHIGPRLVEALGYAQVETRYRKV